MKQTHIKLTSRKRFKKGRLMEYRLIGAAMFCLVPKSRDFKTQISTETWVSHFSGKASPALQRTAAVSTSNCPQSISQGRDALELRFGAELRLTCQGKNGSQGTEKGFAMKLLDKTELCRENEIWNETVRRLTSLLLAPLLQRGPGVLAESLTSRWDASSCKRLSFS